MFFGMPLESFGSPKAVKFVQLFLRKCGEVKGMETQMNQPISISPDGLRPDRHDW